MADFLDDNWRQVFARQGLDDFESLWRLDIGWFEEPNQRRGGWSGVSRMPAEATGDASHEAHGAPRPGLFIKRQLNHTARTWAHPVKGILTFQREFANLLLYRRHGIATLTPVYFAMREAEGQRRAILITEELSGFEPFEEVLRRWWRPDRPAMASRKAYAHALAKLARDMHRQRIQHNCFYPKHVFVRACAPDGDVEARVIDLEKTKRRLSRASARLRDLDTLNRHAGQCSRTDRLRFLLAYTGQSGASPEVKKLWRQLAARDRARGERKATRKHV